jgi:hypothetical protein
MGLEQPFCGTRPNLSFAAAGVGGRIFIERTAAGPTEHVNVVEHD